MLIPLKLNLNRSLSYDYNYITYFSDYQKGGRMMRAQLQSGRKIVDL